MMRSVRSASKVWFRSMPLIGTGVLAATLLTGAGPTATAAPTPRQLVYVASASPGPLTAYPASARGAVAPTWTLRAPKLSGTVWDPWGVAIGADGSLYVQSFISDATTFVFPPGSHGDTSPTRVFRVGGPDSRAIAVDAAGDAYVATGEGSAMIDVAAPDASGRPVDLYSVPPVRTIDTDEAIWHPAPDILTPAGPSDVAAAVVGPDNAIDTFAGGAVGTGTPVGVISGAATGLGSCSETSCDQLAVASSPLSDQLDVAVSAATATRIETFTAGSDGDVAPTCTIDGGHTHLADNVVTGIAVSPTTGKIYVLAKTAEFGGTGQVLVFAPGRCGDVAPLAAFHDRTTRFTDGMGIAVGP